MLSKPLFATIVGCLFYPLGAWAVCAGEYVTPEGRILQRVGSDYPEVNTEASRCWYHYWRVNKRNLRKPSDRAIVQRILNHYRAAYEAEFLALRSRDAGAIPDGSPSVTDSGAREKTEGHTPPQDRRPATQPSLAHLDPYVTQCIRNKSGHLGVGWSSWSDGHYHEKMPPRWFERQSDSIRLTVVAHTSFYRCDSEQERNALYTRIKRLMQNCVRPFYRSQGIDLNFIFGDQLNAQSQGAEGQQLTIACKGPRSEYHSKHWVVANEPDHYACGTITHEILHWLGLPDEYPDSRVPSRPIGAMNSIMRTCWCHPSETRMYPHHLKTVLGAYCD